MLGKRKHRMSLNWKHSVTASLVLLATCLPGQSVLAEAAAKPSASVVKRLTELYGTAALPSNLLVSGQTDPLGHLLALQKRNWPSAWVTSTFYDWRTVSKYRRKAGLHLGYDIALPFGSRVSAGWGGTVVAVIPWTDTEYGVTVSSPDGTEVTYGHITPTVAVGRTILPGQIVGTIASDHVDVKMRDKHGRYIPFGEGSKLASVSYHSRLSKNQLLTAWLVAKSTAEQAQDDLYLANNASKKWELEKRAAERRIKTLDKTLEQLSQDEFKGLISRKRLEELKQERRQAQSSLADVEQRYRSSPQELAQRKDASVSNLQLMESWARSEGLSWTDVEALIVSVNSKTPKQPDSTSETSHAGLSLAQLQKKSEQGRQRLKLLEDLYLAGGLSKQEIEDRRLEQQLLEEEYKLRANRKYQ